MTVLSTARLTIRDQNELLNQIAGTYKDFYRAAMEYVDNAIDAAAILRHSGMRLDAVLRVHIDTVGKKVSFTDNCGGMSAKELCELVSEVGKSKKKTVAWANGQFGFGVHAFRAFAKLAEFTSKKNGDDEAMIKIDRTYDENTDVVCEATNGKHLDEYGTRVTISKFDIHVFKKPEMFNSLVAEMEHHFDDVLRAGLITIQISEDKSKPYSAHYFDFHKLSGIELKKTYSVDGREVIVDLKILDRPQDNRLPVLTNKQRRIQTVADLKSYKTFLRSRGHTNNVWANPFVVGFVEINDLCSPNLTRDDLKDSASREVLFSALLEAQKELEKSVDDVMNKKSQDSFKKLSKVMSDCLAKILKGFKLQFESAAPNAAAPNGNKAWQEDEGPVAFGGAGPGGGGVGPDGSGGGGKPEELGKSGPGSSDKGGGSGDQKRGQQEGASGEQTSKSSGPQIDFQNHAGEERVIDLGGSLIVNTQHPDFIQRNPSKAGKIKLDPRLINYVSIAISPYLVHRLFEKRGKLPTALEVGFNVINLTTQLEQELNMNMLGHEIEQSDGSKN